MAAGWELAGRLGVVHDLRWSHMLGRRARFDWVVAASPANP
jgi:hypothetical protein